MKLSISQLIYAGFLALIAIMVTISILVWNSNSVIMETSNEIKNDDVPGVILYLQLLDELGDMQSNVLEYLTGEEDEKHDFEENHQEFKTYFNQLKPLESATAADRSKMATIEAMINEYVKTAQEEVFNDYDPVIERWAINLAKQLEENQGKELEVLLDKLKEEEFNDALKSTDLRESLNDDLPGVRYYLELIDELGDMLLALNGYINGDAAREEAFNLDAKSFQSYLLELNPLEQKPNEVQNLQKIQRLYDEIKEAATTVFSKFDPESKPRALAATDKLEHEIFATLEDIMDKSSLDEKNDTIRALDLAHKNISMLESTIALSTPTSALFGIFIAFIIARSIKRRLTRINAVLEVANKISNGDLTSQPILDKNNDEVSALADAINQMSESLNHILIKVRDVSLSVTGSSNEIKSQSELSTIKNQEQEEKAFLLATAIQEMSATAQEVATLSSTAFENSKESESQAVGGGDIVKNTVYSIESLSKAVNEASASVDKLGLQSNEIGEIITVINSIAEQTNLLALNAAIEAARAGEAGRGFAVVADEVRNLAARTTEATKQVSSSIGSIQTDTKLVLEKIKQGSEQASESVLQAQSAGVSLDSIVVGFKQLSQMIESIVSAADEQSQTSSVMAQDVTIISDASSENATISQTVTEQSKEMNTLAKSLAEEVSLFKFR